MKFVELTTSTAFRLAAAFACVFAMAVLLVFTVLYVQVGRELENRLAARLAGARVEFQRVYQRDGFNDLAVLVADDVSAASDYDTVLLLKGPEGDFVAGNIQSSPNPQDMRWLESSSFKGLPAKIPAEQRYLTQSSSLQGDGTIVVGISDAEIRSTRQSLLRTLGWGLLGTVLLAIGTGVMLGQRAQRQIDRLAHTLTAIRRGDLTARVPVTARGGDIDVVSHQINGTLDQLQNLFQNVNQSSADIAHDLKTPIGRLRQRLEAMRRTLGASDDSLLVIDGAIAEVDAIVQTFDALLNITQLEAGARRARFKTVDLADVVDSVAEAYEAVAEDAGMRLTLDRAGMQHALLLGDRDLLSRLLVNLIENAIRHCPPGTAISVSISRPISGPALTVTDNGPGIPEGEREKVFRRLYRLEKSRTTPGSGLGLALVKAIADVHGAQIRLDDNRPGVAVTVSFPPLTAD